MMDRCPYHNWQSQQKNQGPNKHTNRSELPTPENHPSRMLLQDALWQIGLREFALLTGLYLFSGQRMSLFSAVYPASFTSTNCREEIKLGHKKLYIQTEKKPWISSFHLMHFVMTSGFKTQRR